MSDHTRNQSAGVDQVEVTRRTLRQSGLNEQALAAIEAANAAIDRQTGRK
jgi:hypothetical protein